MAWETRGSCLEASAHFCYQVWQPQGRGSVGRPPTLLGGLGHGTASFPAHLDTQTAQPTKDSREAWSPREPASSLGKG